MIYGYTNFPDRDRVTHPLPPVAPWTPPEDACPACDGEGSMMYEWAKAASVRCGGRAVIRHGHDRHWYERPDGSSIEMKTIGLPCSVCDGTKKKRE